jgi:hypothetical protein
MFVSFSSRPSSAAFVTLRTGRRGRVFAPARENPARPRYSVPQRFFLIFGE